MNCPNCGGPMVHCWRYCIRRAIAFAMVALSCSLVTAGGNPSLLLFTNPAQCPPCRKFDSDWSRDKAFRDAITQAYSIVPAYQPQTHPAKFTEYGITGVPTWVIVEASGREVGRVSGYTTPTDLWTRLRNATKNTPPRRKEQAAEPPSAGSVPNPGGDVLQRLDSANRALEAERDALRAEKRAIEQRLIDAQKRQPKQADPTPQINALTAELRKLQQQTQQREAQAALAAKRLQAAEQMAANAQAEAKRLREQAAQPPAPLYVPPAEPIDSPEREAVAESTTTQTSIDTTSLSSSWVSVMKSLAVGAVAIAAPQVAIPLTAGLGAAGWLWSKRKQRLAKVRPAPPAALGSNANPITFFEPASTKTETKYVVTESDVLGEAYKEAVRRVGNSHRERMPGIVDVLKQVDAAAQHIAHGARVVRRPTTESQSETLPS